MGCTRHKCLADGRPTEAVLVNLQWERSTRQTAVQYCSVENAMTRYTDAMPLQM